MMQKIEQNIRKYFESWIKKDRSDYSQLFSNDVRYVECYGPAYCGLDEICQWFDDWNQRGTVLQWEIKQILVQDHTAVCEWYFSCEYDGEVGGFDGVSWIEFDEDGLIVKLKEFQCKTPNYYPYAHLKSGWKTDFSFKLAVPQDLPEVLRLFSDAVELMNSKGIDQWDTIYPDEQTLSGDIQNKQMHLLMQNGGIVSVIVLNEEQDAQYQTANWRQTEGKTAVVHRLCVKASEQGKGLGRKTILLAQEKLLKQGYDSVRLDAFSQNPSALHLYESLGYQKTGEMHIRKGRFYLYEKLL